MSAPDRCADAPFGRSGVLLPVRWFPDFQVWSRSYGCAVSTPPKAASISPSSEPAAPSSAFPPGL